MTDDKNTDDKKKKAISINENRVRLIGRVTKPPEKKEKYTRVQMLVPSRRGNDKTEWFGVNVDIRGDQQKLVEKAKNGDYLRVSCFLVQRQVEIDGGDGAKRNLLMLQVDDFDTIGLVEGKPIDKDPVDDGMCVNELILAGRYILRKKDRDAGKTGPEVRKTQKGERSMTFINVVYNNPRNENDEGTWLDVSLFGPSADFAGKFLKHNDQVFVFGELSKTDADFTVKGKKPSQLRIAAKPYGFQSVPIGRSGGGGKEPSGPDPSMYDGDTDVPDDDLPF